MQEAAPSSLVRKSFRGAESSTASIDLRCRYKYTKCTNIRAFKRNGERHSLCRMHRDKANDRQRKLDQKKRMLAQLQESGQLLTASSSSSDSSLSTPKSSFAISRQTLNRSRSAPNAQTLLMPSPAGSHVVNLGIGAASAPTYQHYVNYNMHLQTHLGTYNCITPPVGTALDAIPPEEVQYLYQCLVDDGDDDDQLVYDREMCH